MLKYALKLTFCCYLKVLILMFQLTGKFKFSRLGPKTFITLTTSQK